ncbi:MAG: hypothetical protein IT168_08755 [Bryobacterales bacterium]|nr:hypothetical protein [Bryobacterales bacterium]
MNRALVLLFSGLLVLGSCSSSSTPKTAEKKAKKEEKAEPVAAMKAYYRIYQSARTWAADVEGLKMESITLNSMPGKEGLYPAWRLTLVSQSKRGAKSYTYSVVAAEGLYKDVFAGHDEAYAGPRGQTAPFPIQALKIDSDAAYQTAVKKSADYLKKNPDLPVHMVLEKTKEFGNPVWRVYWGTTINTSNYSILVDASTGDYIRTMH